LTLSDFDLLTLKLVDELYTAKTWVTFLSLL